MTMYLVRVFVATSLDGFIAGPKDELDWLTPQGEVEDTFTPFLARIGALLMGRRTYDVVSELEAPWAYGETPVLVATRRPLSHTRATVRAVSGDIRELVHQAQRAAGHRDVYLDGGALIRSALAVDLVDELTVTLVPVLLGSGIALFSGATERRRLSLSGCRELGAGLVELRYTPAR